jgi:hypothetical protein
MDRQQQIALYKLAGERFKKTLDECSKNISKDKKGTPMFNSWRKQQELVHNAIEDRVKKVKDDNELVEALYSGLGSDYSNPNI